MFKSTQLLKVIRQCLVTQYATTETAATPTKKDFYKNMNQEDNTRPANWDTAKPFEEIPGPKPLPVVGNMHRFMPRIGEFYNLSAVDLQFKLHEQYGNICALRGIHGRKDLVIIYEAEDTETFVRNEGVWPVREFGTSFAYYRNHVRKDVFQGAGGLLTVHGEDWYNFRTIVNPILMQPKNMQQYVTAMATVASELVENIEFLSALNEQGEMPENFLHEIYKWALESVGVVTLDKHFGCLDRNLPTDSEAMKLINSVLEMFGLIYRLDFAPQYMKKFSPDWKRFIEVMNFITDTNIKYVDEALAKLDNSPTLTETSILQKLIQKDRKVAVAMALDMLMAGVDTTGKTLAACLYFLAKNPDKQEIYREEIKKYLPNKDSSVTNDVLNNLQYTKAVIREALRISPIIVGTARTSLKDFVLRGYQIPKGVEIMAFLLLHSNSDKYFKHPEKFIPERWLKSTTGELSHKNVSPFVSLPFGFGPRSCVGKRLANLEMETALPKIIRNFELSWPYEDMKFGGTLLYGVDAPLKIHVKPLSS